MTSSVSKTANSATVDSTTTTTTSLRVCPCCSKTVALAELSDHLLQCTSATPPITLLNSRDCPLCGLRFHTDVIESHVNHCLDAPPLQCPWCNTGFPNLSEIQNHIRQAHSEEDGSGLTHSDCPVCFEPITRSSYCVRCKQALCGRCSQQQTKCPFCRAFPYQYTSNLAAIASATSVPEILRNDPNLVSTVNDVSSGGRGGSSGSAASQRVEESNLGEILLGVGAVLAVGILGVMLGSSRRRR